MLMVTYVYDIMGNVARMIVLSDRLMWLGKTHPSTHSMLISGFFAPNNTSVLTWLTLSPDLNEIILVVVLLMLVD